MNLIDYGITNLSIGLELEYKTMHGYVKFIDEMYFTMCLHRPNTREYFGDICLCVYPPDYDKVTVVSPIATE